MNDGASSFHNHSLWSDGEASMEAMVAAARTLGLRALGISDHLIVRPDGSTHPCSIEPARLPEYVADVVTLKASWGNLCLGLEVDWFLDSRHAIQRILAAHDFDFIIGSVHEVDGFVLDWSAAEWDAYPTTEQDHLHRLYWESMISLADSGLFDIVGHLDLSKKFGHRPRLDLGPVISQALDAIANADMVVELNTAGWFYPCAEAYPSLDLLRECFDRGIPVMVAADAHCPAHLVRAFDRATDLLAEVGYRETAVFSQRRRHFVALDR
jgi:histidinol-phosphatase (PHP family)